MTNEEAIEWLKVEYENARCDECIEDEYVNALEMAIKALEIVNDFERAQIITGGRLNGRTHAYKCGLADGQRLANGEKLFNILPLEQQPSEDTEVIKVSKGTVKSRQGRFVIYDVEWFKEHFYSEEMIYGQPKQPCKNCISREAVTNIISTHLYEPFDDGVKKASCYGVLKRIEKQVDDLPTVTPERSDDKCTKI